VEWAATQLAAQDFYLESLCGLIADVTEDREVAAVLADVREKLQRWRGGAPALVEQGVPAALNAAGGQTPVVSVAPEDAGPLRRF